MPLTVTRVPIASLHLDPANVRKHGAKNLDAIRASISEFGQVEPLIVQKGKGKIIGGNGRYQVLKKMGVKEVDVVEVEVDDVHAAMLGIALNRTGELAEWDDDGLKALLEELDANGMNIEPFAFDEDEPKKAGDADPTADDLLDMGLAFVLIDCLGAAYKTLGFRLRNYPAHPAFVRAHAKSTKWAMVKEPGTFQSSGKTKTTTTPGLVKQRPCATFEYRGAPMDRMDAHRLLAAHG